MNPYMSNMGNDGKWYVDGPSRAGECSYYGGAIYADLRMRDEDEADRAAKIANIAFKEGYERAQREIRKSLGLDVKT